MKLLLDQNLPVRLARLLEQSFPGTNHVRPLGLETARDEEIWRHAREQGYTIVTKDSDYYDMSVLQGWPPKVIWLQCGNVSNAELIALVAGSVEAIRAFLLRDEDGCLEID